MSNSLGASGTAGVNLGLMDPDGTVLELNSQGSLSGASPETTPEKLAKNDALKEE